MTIRNRFLLISISTFAVVFLPGVMSAQESSGYTRPWQDPSRALVLDPFSQNKFDCSETATDPRVAAIIHKATDGLTKDMMTLKRQRVWAYEVRKHKCKNELGFKWGSYHLGRAGNPEAQAEFYVKQVKPESDEVMALDVEGIGGNNISISEAVRFVKRVQELTGRYPLLYITGSVHKYIQEGLRNQPSYSIFKNTPLWYARYCDDISCYFPPKNPAQVLDRPALWQFASEINCRTRTTGRTSTCEEGGKCKLNNCPFPRPIAGTDDDMDVNIYNGTVEELRSRWPKL